MPILCCVVKPNLQKGAQWTKVASRGDGTTTAEVVCQAEGIPRVDFSWEKKGVRMDFANPRSESMHYYFLILPHTVSFSATVSIWFHTDESSQLE